MRSSYLHGLSRGGEHRPIDVALVHEHDGPAGRRPIFDGTDLALDSIESAVDRGLGHKAWIDHDSDLDSIRSHPRFQKVVEAVS